MITHRINNFYLQLVLIQLCLMFFFSVSIVVGQTSNTITNISIGDTREGEPVTFTVELLQPGATSNIRLAYKPFDETEFKITDMQVIGKTASFTLLPEDVTIPLITYYFIVDLTSGEQETYPLGVLEGQAAPLELTVSAKSEKDKEIIVLSPAPGETVPIEDLFISVSLIKAGQSINPAATKLFLNNNDITDKMLLAGDLILFYSNNFPGTVTEGAQSLRVEVFDSTGNLYHSITSNFSAVKEKYLSAAAKKFSYRADFIGESRNENYAEESKWYNNLTAELTGRYDDWRFRGYAYVTSEEDKTVQPQHRFSASAKNNWFNLRVGDSYPQFPNMIMTGKRLRGLSGGINLGFFNIDAVYGEITREVEGSIIERYSDTSVVFGGSIIKIDPAKHDGYSYAKVNLGTYSRDIFAVRPSFGSGQTFQFGLTYLHSKDDHKSIEFGQRPQENAVFGTDLKLSLDSQNILLTGQAAFSLKNSDISKGELTDAEIDTIFGGDDSFVNIDPETVKNIKKILGSFITVNENIGPLNPGELSSLSAETALQLNYFQNTFKATYVYRGNDYYSFGQDYLRRDVKGFNFADRIRLLDNTLFVTLGFEKLQDNLQGTKLATTDYTTLNTSVSYFPRTNFPSITLGYTRYDNGNDADPNDPKLMTSYVDDVTNKFLARLGYNFTAGIRHNSSLNFITSSREDKSIYNGDAKYISTSLSLNSYWTQKLTSYFSMIFYNSNFSSVDISYDSTNAMVLTPKEDDYNYVTVSLGAKYKLLEDKLELSATLTPSFGDLERQLFDLLAQYKFLENLRLAFKLRLVRIPELYTNSIAGLTLYYNI